METVQRCLKRVTPDILHPKEWNQCAVGTPAPTCSLWHNPHDTKPVWGASRDEQRSKCGIQTHVILFTMKVYHLEEMDGYEGRHTEQNKSG